MLSDQHVATVVSHDSAARSSTNRQSRALGMRFEDLVLELYGSEKQSRGERSREDRWAANGTSGTCHTMVITAIHMRLRSTPTFVCRLCVRPGADVIDAGGYPPTQPNSSISPMPGPGIYGGHSAGPSSGTVPGLDWQGHTQSPSHMKSGAALQTEGFSRDDLPDNPSLTSQELVHSRLVHKIVGH